MGLEHPPDGFPINNVVVNDQDFQVSHCSGAGVMGEEVAPVVYSHIPRV